MLKTEYIVGHICSYAIVQSTRMLNLSLKELKLIAKNRDIKGYKIMSENTLLSIINAPEPIKVIWAINKTIKDIRNKNSDAGKTYGDISSSIMGGSNTVCKKYFLLFLHGQKRSIPPSMCSYPQPGTRINRIFQVVELI